MRRRDAAGECGALKTPAVLAWLRLARVFSKIERRSQTRLRAAGLTGAQFDVLAQLGVREGCTQQELAGVLLVTKGNVTQLLARLEECGLVYRATEGRTKRVWLTDAGRALRRRVVPEHECFIAEQLGALTRDEQRELLALLRTLDRSLDGQEQTPWREERDR